MRTFTKFIISEVHRLCDIYSKNDNDIKLRIKFDMKEWIKYGNFKINLYDLVSYEKMNKDHIYKNDIEMQKIKNLEALFTDEEILEAIKSLKTNKAPGPDQIRNELLKELNPQITPLLRKLFNNYLNTGVIDYDLIAGKISMLHKKDDRMDPSNYRPINLLNGIYKILQKCIKTRLEKVLLSQVSETQ